MVVLNSESADNHNIRPRELNLGPLRVGTGSPGQLQLVLRHKLSLRFNNVVTIGEITGATHTVDCTFSVYEAVTEDLSLPHFLPIHGSALLLERVDDLACVHRHMTTVTPELRRVSWPKDAPAVEEPWSVSRLNTSMTMWELDKDFYFGIIGWAFATIFLAYYVVAPTLTNSDARGSAVTSWKCIYRGTV